MGEVIYGHDFKAKAEKERETMETIDVDAIVRKALFESWPNISPNHFVADEKDQA